MNENYNPISISGPVPYKEDDTIMLRFTARNISGNSIKIKEVAFFDNEGKIDITQKITDSNILEKNKEYIIRIRLGNLDFLKDGGQVEVTYGEGDHSSRYIQPDIIKGYFKQFLGIDI